ncbi:MAG: alkaline phosphatase [Bacteroidales bacterium]|nr:alkaline phosphatase [Bacteroidales bacterium]
MTIFLFSISAMAQELPSKPKNIILMIGDGMGLAQITAAMTVNGNNLQMERFTQIGLQKTHSSDNYVTDSGASGTAMATGEKTYNGAIGVDTAGNPLPTILEYAEKHGKATGLVTTCAITHATPAAFIAHVPNRSSYEDIAADFLKTDIDVFIGGGLKHFRQRADGKDLTLELEESGYRVVYEKGELIDVTSGKLAGLLYDVHPPKYSEGRGDILLHASMKAIGILNMDPDGFFLMIEGSQIDWGGHDNDINYIVDETIDFDRVVGQVLDFAEKNGETLVIVTADHECGGLGLNGGDMSGKTVDAGFTGDQHTAVMVPVFASGPGSEVFRGIYENTGIFFRMMEAFGFDPAQ